MLRSNRLLLSGIGLLYFRWVCYHANDLESSENPENSVKFENLTIAENFNFETTAEGIFFQLLPTIT